MTQPCRLCLNLKATQCQPCPRLKLILTSCVISRNWMAEQISKGGPNPLVLRNLSQVFSFLPPMKAGVPSEKGARYNPCAHTGSPKGGRDHYRQALAHAMCLYSCVSLTYVQTYRCVLTGNLHNMCAERMRGGFFWQAYARSFKREQHNWFVIATK